MKQNIDELTLLLLYLTSFEEEGYAYDENGNLCEENLKRSWKGYSFDSLNDLTDKGYLYPTNHKNKSVTLTKEGIKFAEELIKKYIKDED